MIIPFSLKSEEGFFQKETLFALQWLRTIWDADKKGWAWVQFIHPNEQNTAEVISTFVDYIDTFQDDQLDFIVESINHWLLDTTHPKISIDFVGFCWHCRKYGSVPVSSAVWIGGKWRTPSISV